MNNTITEVKKNVEKAIDAVAEIVDSSDETKDLMKWKPEFSHYCSPWDAVS